MANQPQLNDGVKYRYTEEQRAKLESHIEKRFGPISYVLSQVVNKDIQLDFAVIEPDLSAKRNFYILVTMGFGAYIMKRPVEADLGLDRCEMVLMLDANFKIPSDDEGEYWPIRLVKELAHYVIQENLFITWGFTYNHDDAFCPYTDLSRALVCGLYEHYLPYEDSSKFALSDSVAINFMQVVPLYEEEYESLLAVAGNTNYEATSLLLPVDSVVTFLNATSFLSPLITNDRDEATDNFTAYKALVAEDMRWHQYAIEEKNLPLHKITACNHIALLMRYMIENDMMSDSFKQSHPKLINKVLAHDTSFDLRAYIRDELSGALNRRFCNIKGAYFLNQYYYEDGTSAPRYASDIDSYALRYFGIERYYSKEFDTEGYLFVPYDDHYYQNIKAIIDHRVAEFNIQRSQLDNHDFQLATLFKCHLNCTSKFFPQLQNDAPIRAKLNYEYRMGAYGGYIPVVIEVNYVLLESSLDIIDDADPVILGAYRQYQDNLVDENKIEHPELDNKFAKRYGTQLPLVIDKLNLKAMRHNLLQVPDPFANDNFIFEQLLVWLERFNLELDTIHQFIEAKNNLILELTDKLEARKAHYDSLRAAGKSASSSAKAAQKSSGKATATATGKATATATDKDATTASGKGSTTAATKGAATAAAKSQGKAGSGKAKGGRKAKGSEHIRLTSEELNFNYESFNVGLLSSWQAYERAKLCLGPLNKPDNLNLSSYWDEKDLMTYPVVVARIPVNDPMQLLPYLTFLYPMNNILTGPTMINLAQYLWKHFLAIPAVITLHGIEFVTCEPLSATQARALAFDILIVGDYLTDEETAPHLLDLVESLASELENRNTFFFPVNMPHLDSMTNLLGTPNND